MSFNFKAAAVVLVVAGSLAAGFWWWQGRGMRPEEQQFARIAIVPFDNLSADASLDAVAHGMAIAIARQIEALPRTRVFYAETGNKAIALGATHIALGTLDGDAQSVAARWRVEVVARRRTREPEQIQQQGAEWVTVATQVAARLSAQIRPEYKVPAPPVRNGEALRLLGESMLPGTPVAKNEALRKAVEADSQCAICWESLIQSTLQIEGPDAAKAQAIDAVKQTASSAAPDALRIRLLDANLRQDTEARAAAIKELAVVLPGDAQVQLAVAETDISQRRLAEAAQAYKRAWDADPSNTDALNQLGYVYAWMGQFDEALKWLAEYDRAEPASANPADSRGEVLLMAGRFSEAETSLLASYEKDPNLAGGTALEKAALARWLNGDFKGAGELVEKYLAQRAVQKDPQVMLRRVRWQFMMGQAREAEANLKLIAARTGDPQASLAASYLALYALQARQADAARDYAAQARQSARDPLSMYASAVMTSLLTGELPHARLGRAMELQLRAMSLTLHGKYDEAVPAWQEALNQTPANSDVLAREVLAQVLVTLGRTDEAARLVKGGWPLLNDEQRLLFEPMVYPGFLYTRAAVAKTGNRPDEARRLYDQFLKAAGNRPDPAGILQKARSAVRL